MTNINYESFRSGVYIKSSIPRLRVFVHPSIGGNNRKRLWYTLKTLMRCAGFAWQARCSQDECDILIAPSCCFRQSTAKVYISYSDTILSKPFSFKPDYIFRADGYIVFQTDSNKGLQLIRMQDNKKWIYFDIIGQSFWLLIGGHEQLGKDSNTIRVESNNILIKNNLLIEPLLEYFARLIFQPFKVTGLLNKWGEGRRFAIALTHDVDYPRFLRFPAVGKALMVSKDIRGVLQAAFWERPDYWIFDKIMDDESSKNMRSAFYFSARKGNAANYLRGKYDTTYDIRQTQFRELFSIMKEKGFEIGLHASLKAYKQCRFLAEEINWLRESSGVADVGNRHHCWQLNPESPNETLAMHEQAGLYYDSSLTFHYFNGLRRGTCLPFHPYYLDKEKESEILQLSPVLMDDYMFAYRRLNGVDSPEKYIDKWLSIIEQNEGLMVVDFHQHMLHEQSYEAIYKSYLYLLKEIARRNYILVDTPLNIAKMWISKEKELQKESINEN